MTKIITKRTKRIISIILTLCLVLSAIPMSLSAQAAAGAGTITKTADANTMELWRDYFVLDDARLDTSNAGGVWTDKTVLADDSYFGGKIELNDDNNFLTTLSAIAANKEVVGYTTVPTDTVFILDLSASMDGNQQALINATNDAIKELYKTNNNNRIGVVLYSANDSVGASTYEQSVTRILPIDRYTANNNSGNFLSYSNNTVTVASGVSGTNANVDLHDYDNRKSFNGGTYIQAGLWEAMKAFTDIAKEDTVIGPNNWQSGQSRMPIVVLMSDGAPTTGTSFFADVENSYYITGQGRNQRTVYASNVGNGNQNGMTVGQGFLTQLTASYITSRIKNHYGQDGVAAKSLFYSLGFNISPDNNPNSISVNDIAYSVLNPDASTITDSLWTAYNALSTGSMNVNVKNRNGGNSDVSITKNAYAQSKSYVDEYFAAENGGLENAFKSIVDEIILQSRYYPTHLEGGNPDFSGYVDFTDTLGEYMEVKAIKGILLGDTLFDGHMMASKLADASETGLGTVDNPTALGDEFIRSVKTRLGIASTAEAQALVALAWNDGQLYYDANSGEWSNHIAWYAKADGTYAGFWKSDDTVAPAAAVYKIKSYGFLGETTGSIKNSDMMYMTVQVRENIETGEQTLIWKIPASLVPMVTYLVSLTGASVDEAEDVSLSVEDKQSVSPIRLVYETGLRSDLNPFNIAKINEAEHIADDGFTRVFWNNYFDISAPEHDDHITSLAEFTPSEENERFYYTFDSVIYKKQGDAYVKVNEGELSAGGEYYHRRYVFKASSDKPVYEYEKLSAKSIEIAIGKGWQPNFEVSDTDIGAYIVPKGTVARELTPFDKQKADLGAATKSARMVFHPYVTEHNETAYVDTNLGNNGLLEIVPQQGIKISKTVDVFEAGTSDTFKFRVSADATGSFDAYITDIGKTPEGDPFTATFTNGVYETEIEKDQTLWIVGIPTDTAYTVEEMQENADYKVKSVHVNGVSQGEYARGTVAAHYIDDIAFVNTAIGEGDLIITKQVEDTLGNIVDIADTVLFTAEVTLKDARGTALNGNINANNASGFVTLDQNGTFTVTLHDGESLVLHDIPENTRYTVTETNVPDGFAINNQKSVLSGIIDATSNDQALIVNTYNPVSVSGNGVVVEIIKSISGNRTDFTPHDEFTFRVEREDGSLVAEETIRYNTPDKKVSVLLDNEVYNKQGSYSYTITEAIGNHLGMTYDTSVKSFRVDVADNDKDGALEIVNVVSTGGTVVSGQYKVSADFNNVYMPVGSAVATIEIEKLISGYNKNGFVFALYDSADIANADEIVRSAPTDMQGKAEIKLTYAANRSSMDGEIYTYYLAEVDTGNPNITYSNMVYKVEVMVIDSGDGFIAAIPTITKEGDPTPQNTAQFENVYTPSASDFVTITGKKEIRGDRALNANEFEFVLTPENPANPMPDSNRSRNNADGSFTFGAIEFDTVGTYKYKVTESKENMIGGFDYDDAFYEVEVVVVDNLDATLTATATIMGGNDILFTNTYTPTPIDVTLSGDKILVGKVMAADEFTFKISAITENAPMPSSNTATNDANGDFAFGKINFTKAGVYAYEISEVIGNDARYDYDMSVYTVTITVTDNAEGVLSYKVAYAKNNMPGNGIVFTNGFTPDPITFDIDANFGGKKTLDGRELKENEFGFILINAINGKQIGGAVYNDANGNIAFPELVISEEGTYHYKMLELVGDEKGISYDTNVYHFAFKVNKTDSGLLVIEESTKQLFVAVTSKQVIGGELQEVTEYNAATEIAFENSYKADPVDVTLTAKKVLEGRDLENNEFTFDLYSAVKNNGEYEKDTLIDTAKNDADGNITFKPITIETVGEYGYVIVENTSENAENITYDTSEKKVILTVTDNLDGTYKVEYALTSDNQAAEDIEFVNIYTEPTPVPDPDPEPTPTPEPEPEQTSPQTNDNTNIVLWAAFALISALAVLTVTISKSKTDKSV